MNKKQRIILIIAASLIFIATIGVAASDRGTVFQPKSPSLTEMLTPSMLFGIPAWLLYLAFKDKNEK